MVTVKMYRMHVSLHLCSLHFTEILHWRHWSLKEPLQDSVLFFILTLRKNMADLILEHWLFRIEIVAKEFEKLIRFARLFPFGHIAWAIKYRHHPMGPFLKLFNFGRIVPIIEYNSEDEVQTGNKRRRSEDIPIIASASPLKRICIQEILPEGPEVFEDALEFQNAN